MKTKVNFAHPLTVTNFHVLARYIKENRADIDPAFYPQIMLSGAVSLAVSPFRILEKILYSKKEARCSVKRPLFILGHWRSGTTLLQQMLAQDSQFGFINPLMNFTMNFYHLLGWAFEQVIADHLVDGRPMDNMEYAMNLPLEEYIVFSTIEPNSVYPLNFFPQAFLKYNENAYVDRMPAGQREKWCENYDRLLKKITYLNDNKPLLLKSPDNTARLAVLKRMYPDARFVSIYRNPYTVVRSTIHLYEKIMANWTLEPLPSRDTMEDWVIETFRNMYLTYFEEMQTCGPDTLYEICFESFEKNPLPVMEDLYQALELGGYDQARDAIAKYWYDRIDYQKNEFDYSEQLIQKVNERLGFYFEHYGYQMR
jgi:hypothetical protein